MELEKEFSGIFEEIAQDIDFYDWPKSEVSLGALTLKAPRHQSLFDI